MITEIRRLTDDRSFATEVVVDLDVGTRADRDLATIAAELRPVLADSFRISWGLAHLHRITQLPHGYVQIAVRFSDTDENITREIAGNDPADRLVGHLTGPR
ncbi:hypothetical protein [Actinotalea ferrariae]|nr:hypothetical protein [Actinotalea ferrariae]